MKKHKHKWQPKIYTHPLDKNRKINAVRPSGKAYWHFEKLHEWDCGEEKWIDNQDLEKQRREDNKRNILEIIKCVRLRKWIKKIYWQEQ